MYSTYNEGKSVVAERFVKTLKTKIYKHMAAVSKNVYFDVLDNIVDEYNNTYHKTTKMKPIMLNVILTLNTMLVLMKNILNFKVSDHVRISKYKHIFARGYTLN